MSFFSKFPKVPYDIFNKGSTENIINIFKHVKVADSSLVDDISLYKFYEIPNGARPDQVSQQLYKTPDYYWTFFLINDHLKAGLGAWPLSPIEFERYMETEYDGTVINTRAKYIRNSDGILIRIENSISGRFQIGETVTGLLSGAKGTVFAKDASYQQLIVRDVTGTFQVPEIVRGDISGDTISTNAVFPYQLAPKYYTDASGNVVDNSEFIGSSLDGEFSGGFPNTLMNVVTHREFEEQKNDNNAKIRVIKPEAIRDFVDRFEELING